MKDYTLPPEELYRLKAAHRRIKIKKQADKLKAVYLLGSGWAISDIRQALLLDENTIYRYYDVYKEDGVPGLLRSQYKGSTMLLADPEIEELRCYLEAHPCCTTKEVIDYVEKEFEVVYSVSGMNAFLKRLGFVYKKPRPVPGKAEPTAQKDFIKKYRRIRREMTTSDSLFFMDGVHPQHNPLVQYGWFKKGSKQPLKTNTRYHRLNIQGAVDIDNMQVISQDSNTLNEESTLDLLEKLRKTRPGGRIYLILDNAGYHNTKMVKAYAKHLEIKLLFLPPYSPNLNLIERLWGFLQREVLYNRYYPTFDKFRDACLSFLKNLRWRKAELSRLLTERFEKLPI
jgi:transposase